MNQNTRSNDDRLRARALALREQGFSNPAIRSALGLSGWDLTRLFAGHIDPKHENLAKRAKPELRARARELRMQGWTYPAISRKLRVAKSSLSLWLSDLPKPEVHRSPEPPGGSSMSREEWADFCMHRGEHARQRNAEKRRLDLVEAASQIGELTDRELLLVGVMTYWCEGAKTKPWRRQTRADLINSDPDLVRLYLRFLALIGWGTGRISVRLSIHENADIDAATRYWSEVTGVPAGRFRKPTLKRHKPATVRVKTGDHYHGCLVITARESARLYRWIEGWARGVMLGSEAAVEAISTMEDPPW